MRRVNGWLTIAWFIAAFPICFYLSESVPFLVFLSSVTQLSPAT